ncbi:MAG: DNA adenine methylase [Candidatus Sulfotelmatobacter sp.]
MTTFLRWAGSKRRLIPRLMEVVPPNFDRYVEPFAGSACLFFALRPPRAILGDINGDLVDCYRALKADVEAVINLLTSFRCTEPEYYQVRNQDTCAETRERRAARFIYLNRLCFNGLYRTNRQGRFNVPYGGQKAGALPRPELLRECSRSLGHTKLHAGSFEKTLGKVRRNDFVYIDPPYSIKARRVFNEYSNFGFGDEQLRNLRTHLLRMDRDGARFLVSYGVSHEAKELARGFDFREIVVQRQIAGFANKRRKSRELLITNYPLQ